MRRFSLPDPAVTPRYVAVELRSNVIAWAETAWRPGGVRLVGCGEVAHRSGEGPAATLARLAERLTLNRARIRVTLRHPELRIQRIDLPGLSERDARRVAARRSAELVLELGEPGGATYAMARGKAARPVWLAAVPEEFASFVEKQWAQVGLSVSEFESLHLGLGALARLLPAPAEEELRAFFDIGEAHATCVVTDGEGWLFSRDVSLKMMTDVSADDSSESNGTSERVATELRRTLHYVESELRLGRVTELVVSGAHPHLDDMLEPLARETRRDARLLGDLIDTGPAAGVSPGTAVALGAAMSSVLTRGGSLLPGPSDRRWRSRRLTGRLALTTSLLLALAVGGAVFVGGSLHSLSDAGRELERTWQLVAPLRDKTSARVEARQRASHMTGTLPAFETTQTLWSGALDSIGSLLPDDAVLERFAARREDTGEWVASLEVQVPGRDMAEAAANVSAFATRLGASPLWRVRTLERTLTAPLPAAADTAARVHFRVDAVLADSDGVVAVKPEDVPRG